MNHQPPHHRPAAVLILALLLMSAIIGSSIALSIAISDSSKQTTTLNNFMAASLAADSGLERGLAVVKVGRVDQALSATTNAITTAGNPQTTATIPSTDSLSWPRLLPRESVTFDYLKGSTLTPAEQTITFTGQTINGKLDISWVGLNNQNKPLFTGRYFSTSPWASIEDLSLTSAGYIYDLDGNPASSALLVAETSGFRLRLTALQNEDFTTKPFDTQIISNLTVTGKISDIAAPGGIRAGFPSRILISSTGRVNNSQATKSASVSWQLPTSPIFNYVLFAEGDITPSAP